MEMFYRMLVLLGFAMLISECRALELRDFNIYAGRSVGTNRHESLPEGEKMVGTLGMSFTTGWKVFYSKTGVDSYYTSRQFRYVGLKNETGLDFGNVEVFVQHHSEHQLDINDEFDSKYPNRNQVGVRIHFK